MLARDMLLKVAVDFMTDEIYWIMLYVFHMITRLYIYICISYQRVVGIIVISGIKEKARP